MLRCLKADPDIFFSMVTDKSIDTKAPVDYEHMIGNPLSYQGSPAYLDGSFPDLVSLEVVKLSRRATDVIAVVGQSALNGWYVRVYSGQS